jgi:hypothetical protein
MPVMHVIGNINKIKLGVEFIIGDGHEKIYIYFNNRAFALYYFWV